MLSGRRDLLWEHCVLPAVPDLSGGLVTDEAALVAVGAHVFPDAGSPTQ